MRNKHLVHIEGAAFELPPRTPKIAKKFDEYNVVLAQGNDVKTHYKACELIKELLGSEAMVDLFGTDNKEEISTIDSVLTLKIIDDAYLAPITEFQKEKESRDFDSVAFQKVDELSKNIRQIERFVGAQK